MAKRESNRLTTKQVQASKAAGYYPDGLGLYLQVSDSGSKSWILRFKLNGRSRDMGLGALHTFGLAQAREKAAAQRALLHDRIDPIEARDAERAARSAERARERTFADCAAAYIKAHRAGWRNEKHAEQWTATLGTYCKPFANLPVQRVDTAIVVKALEPIWTTKHETATRTRARIEAVLDWATVRGYRSGDNPARWRGHLNKLLAQIERRKRVRHHPALSYREIGKFMSELRAEDGTPARALEFVILTACRTGELLGAKPTEFNLSEALWTIPATRMKSHREHRVPLSPRALAIVREALKAGDEYVFAGRYPGKPMSNMAMLQLVRRTRPGVVPHGFRSTFRDWTAEQTNYAREVAEMALAHVVGDQTEAAYRRGDLFEKRRRLMAEWARFCDRPAHDAKVLPMRAAK